MSERLPLQMLAGLFLDLGRAAVNVTGDLAAAVVVSRGEHAELVAEVG
jgi:Na+/H+-dicarboxylate symporter